jgi:hypothetical protein
MNCDPIDGHAVHENRFFGMPHILNALKDKHMDIAWHIAGIAASV